MICDEPWQLRNPVILQLLALRDATYAAMLRRDEQAVARIPAEAGTFSKRERPRILKACCHESIVYLRMLGIDTWRQPWVRTAFNAGSKSRRARLPSRNLWLSWCLACCCRVSLEASLLSSGGACCVTNVVPAEHIQDPAAAVAADTNPSNTETPTPVEHRLQLSYTLNDEAVKVSAVTPTAGAVSADAAATASILSCSSTQQLAVSEAFVRAIASSNAVLPVVFTASSRLASPPAATDPPVAASPAAGAKPAKPGKAPPAPEEKPWQPDQQCTLPIDLGAILVGDTELICTWPSKGLSLPPQLQAYSRIQLRIQVLQSDLVLAAVQPIHTCLERLTSSTETLLPASTMQACYFQ